ncbi:hypothetical protein ACN47E_006407 [Coniothyrium glycines]
MLAHHSQSNDVTSRSLRANLGKRPKTFMFIDSSNGGVNAKPDKIVRSFVMKSARNKKPWSTRPKSDTSASAKSRQQSDPHVLSLDRHHGDVDQLPELDWTTWSSSGSQKSVTSPSANSTYSSASRKSSYQTYESPRSANTSPHSENHSSENAFQARDSEQRSYDTYYGPIFGLLRSFDCLSVQLDPHSQRILHQFVVSSTHLFPIDPYKSSEKAATDWFAGCIQSPHGASFIYTALSSSAHLLGRHREIYRWRAVREVNNLLGDSSQDIDDTTIATVLILLALEEAKLADPTMTDDERKCSVGMNEAHFNGLKAMINQRGGLAALNRTRCMQVCLLMYSIAQCITTFKPPYAILYDPNGQIEDYAKLSSTPLQRYAHILQPFQHLVTSDTLFSIITSTVLFTSDLTSWYDSRSCPIDALDLQKHASLLQYRLFAWYSQSATQAPTSPLDQSICLALIIFMVFATDRHSSIPGSRLSKAVTKLCEALQHTPPLMWSVAPDLLLWTTTMGGMGAGILPRHSGPLLAFLKAYCWTAFAAPGPPTSAYLAERMQCCLWIPCIFDSRARRLWISSGLCVADACGLAVDDALGWGSDAEREQQPVDAEYALGQSTAMRFLAHQDGARQRALST